MASIVKRETSLGIRYDVRFRVNGIQRKRTFQRSGDAESYRRKIEADELVGLVIDPRGGEILLEPYAERWLETRLVRGRPLTPMTIQGYRGVLRRNVYPTFGNTKIRRITPEGVREWHSAVISRSGVDAAAKSYRVLRAVLNTAVADDLIGRNPCRVSGAGTEHAPERPILDISTVIELSEVIEPRYRALVLLGGFGGLRTGELLGLERLDVDVERSTVRVRQQALEVQGKGRIVTQPKTESGRRTVAVPRSVMSALDEHLNRFAAPGPAGVVFTGPVGTPLRRATLSAAWREACGLAGIAGAHVHDLRHHAATIAARMPGITTKELMARIGHKSPRAALVYQHATEERDRTIARYLDDQVSDMLTRMRAPKTTQGPELVDGRTVARTLLVPPESPSGRRHHDFDDIGVVCSLAESFGGEAEELVG